MISRKLMRDTQKQTLRNKGHLIEKLTQSHDLKLKLLTKLQPDSLVDLIIIILLKSNELNQISYKTKISAKSFIF